MSTILNNTEVNNLNELLSFELAKYEAVGQENPSITLEVDTEKETLMSCAVKYATLFH